MITNMPNMYKPEGFEHYHVCFFDKKGDVSSQLFDLSLKEVAGKISTIANDCDFIVMMTIDPIETVLNYINNCENGAILLTMDKEDIFRMKRPFLIDKTLEFKKGV